jgi:hypothetical protein
MVLSLAFCIPSTRVSTKATLHHVVDPENDIKLALLSIITESDVEYVDSN